MTVSVTRKTPFILMMNPPFLGSWYAWRLAKKKPPADRPTGRPADRHAPWNYVCLRKFLKQKAAFFILSTPPLWFCPSLRSSVTLPKARKYVTLLALRFDNFEFGVEYVTLLALRLNNFHRWDGRLSVCILCRRHAYCGGCLLLYFYRGYFFYRFFTFAV